MGALAEQDDNQHAPLVSHPVENLASRAALAQAERGGRLSVGLPPGEALRMENKVGAIAHHDGLPFTSDRVLANSFDVHRVLQLANAIGLGDQLLGVLQRALFSGRANVYDHTVLADFASRLGIIRSRVEEVLSGNEYADAVRADEKEAEALGATGVPFTVFNGRIAIPGAASIEGFGNAINRAWSDQ